MIYFANPSTAEIREHMKAGRLGFIDTPAQGNKRDDTVMWCADNGAFSDNWNEKRWWSFLVANAKHSATCVFAVAPDVVGNHDASLKRSRPWLAQIRALGFRVAFVVQDGATIDTVPWDEFDVLFIGGAKTDNPADEWKLGAEARALILEGKRRNMWVHCGRVNSGKRYAAMAALGVDSADGTYMAHGPDELLPNVLHWINLHKSQPPLFDLTEETA